MAASIEIHTREREVSFRQMLIIVDLDSEVEVITSLARRLAAKTSASFSVLGVIPEFPVPTFKKSRATKAAQHLANQLADALKEKVDMVVAELPDGTSTSLVSGRLIEEVNKAVIINHADLVLKMAAPSSGARAPVFGGVDKRLIRNCPAPVWVVRPDVGSDFDRIAVAIDRPDGYADCDERRDLALAQLGHSAKLATSLGIETVDVIYAWDAVGFDTIRSARSGITPQEAKEYMQDCEQDSIDWITDFLQSATKLLKRDVPKFVPHLVFGRPRQVLVDKVHELESDILILGTIARSGVLGLLIGNTAEDILDRVECSILAIKPGAEVVSNEG